MPSTHAAAAGAIDVHNPMRAAVAGLIQDARACRGNLAVVASEALRADANIVFARALHEQFVLIQASPCHAAVDAGLCAADWMGRLLTKAADEGLGYPAVVSFILRLAHA